MSICLRRREFIAGLGGAASWPLYASAQHPAIPVIGYLFFGSPAANASAGSPAANGKILPDPRPAEFRRRLKEDSYEEGRNIASEFRWGNNQDRFLELAADLVRRQVAVIVTPGGLATFAAKAATSTIPIVFMTNADPVSFGLVASLSRPGGNMTAVRNKYEQDSGARRTAQHSGDLSLFRLGASWWPHELRGEIRDMGKDCCRLRGTDSPGRQAGKPAYPTTN
jgi:putative ABC transport system substrate-binding protein